MQLRGVFHEGFLRKMNNLVLKGQGYCSDKVLHSGFNTFLTVLKGRVLNPLIRIKKVFGNRQFPNKLIQGAAIATLRKFCNWLGRYRFNER
jgi:hypothetical protein